MTKPEQYAESIKVQQSAWGLDRLSGGIPPHLLIAGQRHSGLVLGAYDGKKMVGVLFGFTALQDGKPYHYSHITGVAKDYQSKGIGYKLKLAQRKWVIDQGMDLVKWTFDPLQAPNAYFNIGKLGGICKTYVRELYGTTLGGSLNLGSLTDRFEVEWWVKSERAREMIEHPIEPLKAGDVLKRGIPVVNPTKTTKNRVRKPSTVRLNIAEPMLLVEIPENIVKIRKTNPELSDAWTLNFRRIFEHYFHRGYTVSEVLLKREGDERRIFYLLQFAFQP